MIRVRDDGPGMTPELLSRAFDLFAQGSEGGNRPAALLELRGHQVFVAHDGVEALSRARAEEPGVILLDIEMPGMNGYEVARSIRADARLSDKRLIAVSGHAAATDRSRSRLSDFDAHMVKPVDPDKLFSAIES